MAFCNPDPVKRGNYIKLSKVLGTIECVKCFIEPKLGNKYYKLLIAFCNPNLVKHGNHIKLSKVFSTTECVKYLIN